MRLTPENLLSVFYALRGISAWDDARFIAEHMLEGTSHGSDRYARNLGAIARRCLADCLYNDPGEGKSDLATAERLYAEALDISRALARELDTPEARRDVSVSLNYVDHVAHVRGDLATAERLCAEDLDISRALARELDTPEARRDVSVSLHNVADMARARGDLATAGLLYTEGLEFLRALAR
ncbi:MAG: hypothetical protein ACK52I_33875, partial [Pseudomonadota bacterium]